MRRRFVDAMQRAGSFARCANSTLISVRSCSLWRLTGGRTARQEATCVAQKARGSCFQLTYCHESRGAWPYCLQRRRRTAGPFGPSEAAARDTGWLLTNGMKNMIYGSILDAQTPANCAHARVAVTRTRRGGLPRVPDLIRRPPNCSVENRLNCSVVVFKVLHNSRLRCTQEPATRSRNPPGLP